MFKKIPNFLLRILGELNVAFSRIDIDVASNDRLVIDVNTRKIVAVKAARTISSSGRILARFETIQSITVEHFTNGRRLAWWMVSLQLVGGRKIRIGKSLDGVQVSVVAAHLGTVTGKSVCSSSKVGW